LGVGIMVFGQTDLATAIGTFSSFFLLYSLDKLGMLFLILSSCKYPPLFFSSSLKQTTTLLFFVLSPFCRKTRKPYLITGSAGHDGAVFAGGGAWKWHWVGLTRPRDGTGWHGMG
jgi:hypothetical protein